LKIYIKYTITVILLFHLYIPATAETNIIDSLLNKLDYATPAEQVLILNDISRTYWQVSLEESARYAEKALDLATQLGDRKGMADAMNRLGNARYFTGDYEEALEHYLQSLEIRTDIDDIEGIIGSYNNLYILHIATGNSNEALECLHKALTISELNGDENQIAYFSNLLGSRKSEMHDFEKAVSHIDRALRIFERTGNREGKASVLLTRGAMYRRMSLYDEAQVNYFRALEYFRETGNQNGIASVKNNIGIIHKHLGHLDIALEYFNRSLDIYNETGVNTTGIASILNNIGIIWYEKGDYPAALDYYKKALENYDAAGQNQGIATTSHNIGILHTKMGNYAEALDSYNRSVEINSRTGNVFSLANNYNNLGEMFYLRKEYDSAGRYLEKALEMAMDLNAKELIAENYLFQSVLFSELEDYERALYLFERHDEYRDSIFTEDTGSKIAELRVRHQWESQINQLDLLEKDNQIQQLRIERQRTYLITLGIIAGIAFLFSFIIIRMIRYREKLNMALNEKNMQLQAANHELEVSGENLRKLNSTKDKFFSIIAHDLKNPFNALLGFSETLNQGYDSLSKDQVYTYIEIINKSAANLYQLLENLLEWSKNQTGNISHKPEKLKLLPFVETVISTLRSDASKKGISVSTDIDEGVTAFADKNIIASVLRNLVNNAVKFTYNNGEIKVSAKPEEEAVRVSVTDNGTGIAPQEQKKLFNINYNITTRGTNDEKGTGLGLILCREFVEKSGGRIWVESEPGQGSTFSFTIPG